MKKSPSLLVVGLLLLCTTVMFWVQSCRRTDLSPSSPVVNKEERFFTVPASTSGTVKRIAEHIQEQNDQHHFIEKIIRHEGYAFWDKADIHIGKLPGHASIDTLVLLPLVLENGKQVNSLLACKVSGDKISIFLHRGRRPDLYKSGDDPNQLTANALTMELMHFTNKIFGVAAFKVRNPHLFVQPSKPEAQSKIIGIRTPEVPITGLHTWLSFNVDRCYWYGDDGDQGQVVGVAPGGSNNYAYGEWICYTATVYVFINDYSGGGGGPTVDPGGGGGGGGGGPVTPPTPYGWWEYEICTVQDPNGPQVPVDDFETEPCNNGIREVWHPLYPIFKVNNITSDFTNPCIVAAKNKLPDNMLKIYAAELMIQSEINDEWSIAFSENRNLVDGSNNPMIAESYSTSATKTWNVVLNPLFWEQATQPDATQEIAGLNILHEIIHGCIVVYKEKYNLTTLSTFTTHEVMFKNFILILRKTLMEAYGLTEADATALALQGLDDVLEKEYVTGLGGTMTLNSYNLKLNQFAIDNYQMSIPDAEVIFDQYYGGTKGTRCF